LLRVFQVVADCGGMTAAELELNISTSTISRHVKDLETRLGLTLCRRGRGGFALTPEGERIHAETRQLLAATQSFRTSVDELHLRLGGAIHVAVFDKTASNPNAHIAQAVALFRRQAPDVVLNLHVATIQAIERGVIDGQFHLGIIPEHRRSDSLVYDELFGETMLLYCAQGHPLFGANTAALSWSDARQHAFAGLGYHSPNMEVSHRERLQRSATAYDQESVATFVLSGDFLGFLPDHYARGFVDSGQMQTVAPAEFAYQCHFSAIVRRSPEPSRATRIFQQCLQQAHPPQSG
jgi:DNA-binding transcriptional LysR family regulator